MDSDSFLTQQIQKVDGVPAPVTSAPLPPPAQPAPVAPTVIERAPKKSGRHWMWYAGIGALCLVWFAGAGAYYYFTHRAYSQEQAIALIRQYILPEVVRVDCVGQEGGQESQIGTGFYTHQSDGTPVVETNAHVVLGSDGKYHGCNIYFPRASDGAFYDSSYYAGTPTLYHNVTSTVNGKLIQGLDYAILPLAGANSNAQGIAYPFPPLQKDGSSMIEKFCREKNGSTIEIGAPIYLLGYPGVGGDSLTLTQGVVSGFTGDYEEFIKVSANTNHGNSGGLAVDGQDCYIGIPTQATFNPGANLGLVLSGSFIKDFLNNLTGASTYTPPTSTTDAAAYLKNTYTFPDFSIKYPDAWTLSTTSPGQDGSSSVAFTAPVESALAQMSAITAIYIHPGISAAEYASAAAAADKAALATDSSAHIKDITLANGVKTHEILYVDSSGTNFSMSVGLYVILFRQHGTVYSINSVAPLGPNFESYLLMFAHMGDSITLAQ